MIRRRTLTVQKKGGNVKTIPPYKPVSHDSQSSDSSCEKEGEASCSNASGGVTPTHAGKSKGVRTSHCLIAHHSNVCILVDAICHSNHYLISLCCMLVLLRITVLDRAYSIIIKKCFTFCSS